MAGAGEPLTQESEVRRRRKADTGSVQVLQKLRCLVEEVENAVVHENADTPEDLDDWSAIKVAHFRALVSQS